MEITLLQFDPKQPFSVLEKYMSVISDDRRERIERLASEQGKVTSLLSGLVLSEVLSDRCKVGCRQLRFAYGEHGKPYLPDYPDCCFSLSHSGGYIALACDDEPVGIDIQLMSPHRQHALRFLHPAEQQSILAADNNAEQFCRIWTMKEAYVKLTGDGMSKGFGSFNVLAMPENSFFTERIGSYMLTLCTNKFVSQPKIHTITENELLASVFC